MNNWLWHLDDGSLDEFPEEHIEGYYGFTYIITNLETNKFYITNVVPQEKSQGYKPFGLTCAKKIALSVY
jgi:hypothetical protein